MTLQEFEAFKQSARERGFTHVYSMAGPVPLSEWTPYGIGTNAGIERFMHFSWIDSNRATDSNEIPAGFGSGVWTFCKK